MQDVASVVSGGGLYSMQEELWLVQCTDEMLNGAVYRRWMEYWLV